MSQELVDKIARAVLYEGYILYPYRPCVKTQQRWNFGGLYPQPWTDAQSAGDPSFMQTQCLLVGSPSSLVRVRIRFLHLINRTIVTPDLQPVPSLEVDDTTYSPWQEAADREIDAGEHPLHSLLAHPHLLNFSFPHHQTTEPLHRSSDHHLVGSLLREQQSIAGQAELSAIELSPNFYQLTLIIRNQTPMDLSLTPRRDDALMRTLISTHAILTTRNGEFLSLTDPPDSAKSHAASCQNIGNWPILVGTPPARDTLLASPIILSDYPQIAPESPGDLFDATEIDEILSLRILTLTPEEKRAAASVDPKSKAMLARTESLARDQLSRLHGAMRPSPTAPSTSFPPFDPFQSLEERPKLDHVLTEAGPLRPGDRVILRPLSRADIFDMVLAGKTATILSIEQDFENRIHLAVSIDDDPGNDYAPSGQPGHRFFFSLDEIEPLNPSTPKAHGSPSVGSPLQEVLPP